MQLHLVDAHPEVVVDRERRLAVPRWWAPDGLWAGASRERRGRRGEQDEPTNYYGDDADTHVHQLPGRRTASVVATSPMRLIALFKRDVWALEERSPEVVGRLRALIAERRR